MKIEKIEFAPPKEGITAKFAFLLVIILAGLAAGLTWMFISKIALADPAEAAKREFIESVGTLLAYLLFVMGAMIYLYVKWILQDKYVTTVG